MLNHIYIKNDKPLLVMLHGLLSSLDTFLPLIPLLESHHSLLLVDQRGHGKSAPQGEDYTAAHMAYDLKELLDQLGINEPFFLLGHSMGGRTALAFGELYPNLIQKMVIEDMGIHQRQLRSPEKDYEKKDLALKSRISSLHFSNKEEIYELIAPLFSYAKDLLTSKVIAHEKSYELKFWPEVSVLYGYQGNYSDLTPALTKTHFPVLFMVADPAVGSALTETCIDHIKSHVPRAQFVFIEKSWHTIHKTHPKEFVQALLEFTKSSK